jgi:hypothetical protein
MKAPIRLTDPQYHGVRVVDYKKGKHDIYAKRYDDPSQYQKEH